MPEPVPSYAKTLESLRQLERRVERLGSHWPDAFGYYYPNKQLWPSPDEDPRQARKAFLRIAHMHLEEVAKSLRSYRVLSDKLGLPVPP